MSQTRLPLLVVGAVVAVAVVGLVLVTRSGSGGPQGPQGFLGHDATSVLFLQWTESNGGNL